MPRSHHRPMRAPGRLRQRAWLAALAVSLTCASTARAQLPTTKLLVVSPQGGQQGTEVDLRITHGENLGGVDWLEFSHPGIKARMVAPEPASYGGPQVRPDPRFAVTIAPDVPPGLYEVRAVGRFGISNPRRFEVTDFKELREAEGNGSADKAMAIELGSVVTGEASGGVRDYYKFSAKKGQRVIAEVLAEQIDSRMDATIAVSDSNGKLITRSRNANGRDAMLDFDVPADGEYVLAVYDFLYSTGKDYFYRLKVSTAPYIDYVIPPVGIPGTTSEFTVYGRNLPGGTRSDVVLDGRPLESVKTKIAIPAQASIGEPAASMYLTSHRLLAQGYVWHWKNDSGTSNPCLIGLVDKPATIESEPNNTPEQAEKTTVPCERVGQLRPGDDQDWIEFEAPTNNSRWWIEVTSQSPNAPIDPCLLVQVVTKDAKGVEKVTDVKEVDDEPTNVGGSVFPIISSDPACVITATTPATYRVMVRDLGSVVDDPRNTYRLSIREAKGDFRLVAALVTPNLNMNRASSSNILAIAPWTPVLRPGGTEIIEVIVSRREGFIGQIDVTMEGLPEGVTVSPVTLAPTQERAALVLKAADNVAEWGGVVHVVGTAKIDDQTTIKREAAGGTTIWSDEPKLRLMNTQRIVSDVQLSVLPGLKTPVAIDFEQDKTWWMYRGGKLEIPFKVTRAKDFTEPLTLMPIDLPLYMKAAPLTLDAKTTEGKLILEAGQVPGIYTIALRAKTKVKYEFDPPAIQEAEATQAELAKAFDSLSEELKAASNAKTEAERAEKTALAAVANAGEEKEAAVDAARVATEKKAATETLIQQLTEKRKALGGAKAAADKWVTDTTEAAKPKDVNFIVSSTPVRIRLTVEPVEFSEPQIAPLKIKRGEKLEVPLAIARAINFADPVDIEFAVPPAAKGVTVEAKPIAKGETAGKLTISVAAEAVPGQHVVPLRLKGTANKAPYTVEQKVSLTIE